MDTRQQLPRKMFANIFLRLLLLVNSAAAAVVIGNLDVLSIKYN